MDGATPEEEEEAAMAEGQSQLEVREGAGRPCCSPLEEPHARAFSFHPLFLEWGPGPTGRL